VATESRKFLLFKTLIAVGFAVGIVLLVQTIHTYSYVSGEMLMQEAERDSQRKVNTLVGAVRTAQTQDMEVISGILQEFLEDWKHQVAWIRILDSTGKPLASAGSAPTDPVPPDKLPRLFSTETRIPEKQNSAAGDVFVSIRPFRTISFGGPRPGTAPSRGGERGTPQSGGNLPTFGLPGGRGLRPPIGINWNVEIALLPDTLSGSFASLRTDLVVGVSASLTLMAALVLLALRFPSYLRGQQLERELDLARRVQADLLPSPDTISPDVDFSAECISAWEVGGDFCDVFHVSEDRTALVLGDVSGKGMSAALLMALIHGAIHSVSWTRSTQDHVSESRQLNALLYQKTASERFTSLFWGYFDPQRSTIQYINAGHLPPLLVRKTDGELEVQRLEIGGPVIGLLPNANYQQGEQYVAPGDLLVAFSDGVVEATNVAGEEFGEKRLIAVVKGLWDASAQDIRNAIHTQLKQFTGDAPVGDDQTLIVVRFKHSAIRMSAPESDTVSV
jgi:serine phosphatase RsbU (regulator of sigma subunit)